MRSFSIIQLLSVGFCVLCMAVTPAGAFETPAKEAIAIDFDTGVVLFDKNADERTYPASMTKMMTAYMVFKRLATEELTMEDRFSVSETAWRMQGSKMFVELNNRIRLEDLLQGIIVQSGNDACIVVAEGLAGTEEQFAVQMTAIAKQLGMENTHFTNSTGWPDENHYTTSRDLATLARRLIIDFPQYYHYWAQPEYTYHNITQQNRNLLLYRNIGVDGLKTGHTEAAGYGITISGQREEGGRRVVIVVNGLSSDKERVDAATALYNYALMNFNNDTVLKPGIELGSVPVWYGAEEEVMLTLANETTLTLPNMGRDTVEFKLHYDAPLQAPVAPGQAVGELSVIAPGMEEQRVMVVAASEVPKAGIFKRAIINLKHLLGVE